jgi:hypothetical protein
MSETKLTGLAAVLAAVGIGAESRDSVSRDALNSAITAALAEGEKAGVIKAANDAAKITADAVTATNTRAKAILGNDAAKGREALALKLTFDTSLSAEDAVATLGTAAKTEAPTSRLGQVPDPKVTSGEQAEAGDAGVSLLASVDRMVARNKTAA